MYTKNPVTGKNETLVNTSMLKGAVDGVTSKIADKADKGALESLSEYAVGIAEDLNDKANKSEIQSLSEYVEGRLPKTVYETMVDAYVGLACKVADSDVLEGAAKMAFAANPVKYATSNPDDEGCAELSGDTYEPGNPIYDIFHNPSGVVVLDEAPFLRLTKVQIGIFLNTVAERTLTTWKTQVPNLQIATAICKNVVSLTNWEAELPNLTYGNEMFYNTTIEEWTVELPNLTNGSAMFANNCGGFDPSKPTALKRFRGTLPALLDGSLMFTNCPLDLESIRCIAETINDVNGLTEDWEVTKRLDICVGYDIDSEPLHEEYVETIKNKGWTVTVNDIQQ